MTMCSRTLCTLLWAEPGVNGVNLNRKRTGSHLYRTKQDQQHRPRARHEQRGEHLQGRGAAGASSKRAGDPGKADAEPGAGTARSRGCAGDTSAGSPCRQLDRQQPGGEVRRARHVQLYASAS